MRHTISPTPSSSGEQPHASAFSAQLQSARERFHRLDKLQQWILAGLVALGLIVSFAALVLIVTPDDTVSAGNAPHTSAEQAQSAPPAHNLAGDFAAPLQDGSGMLYLSLHQYSADLTGSFTTTQCIEGQPQTVTGIVTGHLLNDDALSLTYSVPDQPHSTTTIYQLKADGQNYDLTWQDTLGHAQTQRWTYHPDGQTPDATDVCH